MRRSSGLKRKNFYLEQAKIKKVQKVLQASTETDAIDQALDIVLFRVEILESLKKTAGKARIEKVF